jgi:hypothetical protein
MKVHGLLVVLFVCCSSAFGAGRPKPFRSVDLDAIKGNASDCGVKLRGLTNRVVWIDDEHLLAWLFKFCDTNDPKDRRSQQGLALIDMSGRVRSIQLDDLSEILRGPAGTLLVGRGDEVDVMDSALHRRQTIRCMTEKLPCAIFAPSLSSTDSDFAVCSRTESVETCKFYRGEPAVQTAEPAFSFLISHGIPRSPYKQVSFPEKTQTSSFERKGWEVGRSQVWYFDKDGILTRLSSNGSIEPVSAEHWAPKGSNCDGDFSASQPKRFLATCVGAHFYTDGDLDAIFGYSRIALFDVASRHIVARIDGPAYTTAVLSPSGKLIAVTHSNKVHLYRVD